MKKSIILAAIALFVVFAALLVFSGDKQESVERGTSQRRPEVTKAPDPVAVQAPADDPALKDALLGLNPPEVVEEKAPPPVRRRSRRIEMIEAVEESEEPTGPTTLSDYDFQSTVGNWGGVKNCIATNVQRGDERLTGALEVAFTIHADGNVIHSKVVGFSNDHAAVLAPCVEKKARRIRFPTFAGNEDVTKTAKFVF